MTSTEHAVREHLRREYAGVFSDAVIEEHLRGYVGFALAEELLAHVLARRPDVAKVLDVGCGYGSFVLSARERGIDATGVELSSFELEWARQRLAERRPDNDPAQVYVQGDARALPHADETFDVVCLWNVIEHVSDAPAALREAARVLRPGGSLFVIAPNYAALRREAHYHVPWPPLLPRPVAVAYLRALGRDPNFYEHYVHPCTMTGTARTLKRTGLRLRDPRAEKLSDPASAKRPAVRRALRLLAGLHLLGPARVLLRVQLLNPLAPTISLEAVKRP